MSAPTPPKESAAALAVRREQVTQLLAEAFADDRLDVDQLEDRAARAHSVDTVAALDALVHDLGAPVARAVPVTSMAESRSTASIRAVLGSLERRGFWVVPERLSVAAAFGNAELDLREAQLSSGVTEIDARVVCGNLEIIVPPELQVECEGAALLGNFESHTPPGRSDSRRPILRIRARVVLGNAEVYVRLAGESAADAARRIAAGGDRLARR
jgi:hypothetical protein